MVSLKKRRDAERKDNHVKVNKPRTSWGYQKLRETRKDLPQRCGGEHSWADALTGHLSPELCDNECLLFKANPFVGLC